MVFSHHLNKQKYSDPNRASNLLWKPKSSASAIHLLVFLLEVKDPFPLVEPKKKLGGEGGGGLWTMQNQGKTRENNNRNLCFRIHSKSKQGTQSFSKGIPNRWNRIFKCLSEVAVTKKCIEYYDFAPNNWQIYSWKRWNWDKNTCLDTVRGWIVEFGHT